MLLAIDVGNSNIVLGVFLGERLGRTFRLSTHPLVTSDEFFVTLSSLLSLEGLSTADINQVVISSVVPTMTPVLKAAFRDRVPVHVVDSRWPFSFEIAAQPAEHIGADRLVNAEAALREYGSPCIVIDSGTATTLCAIAGPAAPGKRPRYLGGAIAPGLELAIESLARRAAQLYSVELSVPERAIGSNTVEAIRSGTLLGYAGLLEGMVGRFKAEMGAPNAQVVATGGAGRLLKGICPFVDHWESDLTLRGLRYLGLARLQC